MAEEKQVCSSPPAKAPKQQLTVEQPSTGGHWNSPKKTDTPRPKTKKPQQDSGSGAAPSMKPNPTPTGWVTHGLGNCNTKEPFPLL